MGEAITQWEVAVPEDYLEEVIAFQDPRLSRS